MIGLILEDRKGSWNIKIAGLRIAQGAMKNIIGCSFITRGPRCLETKSDWKATELFNFGFFYSVPVFYAIVKSGHLRKEYFNRWIYLIAGTSLLNTQAVTQDCLERSKVYLDAFLIGLAELYGKVECGFNFHLLTHIPKKVQMLGPLWSTALFHNEAHNKTINRWVIYSNIPHLASHPLASHFPHFAFSTSHPDIIHSLRITSVHITSLHTPSLHIPSFTFPIPILIPLLHE